MTLNMFYPHFAVQTRSLKPYPRLAPVTPSRAIPVLAYAGRRNEPPDFGHGFLKSPPLAPS